MNVHAITMGAKRSKKRRVPLLAALGAAFVIALGASGAFAKETRDGGYGAMGGGYTGPGPDLVTVEQAKAMSDDARVALKGYIIKNR